MFIDFVAGPKSGINVAVHEFRYGEESTKEEEMWNAGRGAVIWEARIPRSNFLVGFVAALWRVKVLYVDDSGYMPHWGFLFPEHDLGQLASIVQNLGYQPTGTEEIKRLG